MSDQKKLCMILIAIFVIFTGLYTFWKVKPYFNKNEENLIGNTAGNLNNGGYFCESDGIVFFANSYDGNRLYSMNLDESNIQKVCDSVVQYINADSKNIYYYQVEAGKESAVGIPAKFNGIYYINRKGGSIHCLDKTPCKVVKLLGNHIYYQRYDTKKIELSLYEVDLLKQSTKQLLEDEVNPACMIGNNIYYTGVLDQKYLNTYDVTTGESFVLNEETTWNPDVQGDYVYYMDMQNGYKLTRYQLSTREVTVLSKDRVDLFLVTDNEIFYQRNSTTNAALMVMNKDGSNPQVIAEGNYSDLNATRQNLYFHAFGSTVPLYKIALNQGSYTMETFEAAKTAAVENTK